MTTPPSNPSPVGDRGIPLEPSAGQMQALLAEIGRRTIAFLESLPKQPVAATDLAADAAGWVAGPPPELGSSLEEILSLLFDKVIPCSFNTACPGYLAYVPGGGLYSAALARFLSAAVNRYSGVWLAAPGAVELETQVLRWLAELMGFPEGSLGVITTGGSLSNLIAFVAAREKHLGARIEGGTVYLSEEAHHSLHKAARIAGVAPRHIRTVRVDGKFRLDVDDLGEKIAADRRRGRMPFLVVASAGTVNSGSVDPLAAVADLAAEEQLWLHVDGAYGALFRLLPELSPTLNGMERVDSLALDPHKGLFLPYGTGVLLVRDLEDLKLAYRGRATYMPDFQEEEQRIDFCEVSPELSRDWRGLHLWLPFRLHGVRAFREALQEKRELALRAWQRLRSEPDVEIPVAPELSLFAFRQRFRHLTPEEENQRNRDLLTRINAPRRIMLTGTEMAGRFYLRICVLHMRTHRDRLDEGLEIITQALADARKNSG